jgi:hypothetical protein
MKFSSPGMPTAARGAMEGMTIPMSPFMAHLEVSIVRIDLCSTLAIA